MLGCEPAREGDRRWKGEWRYALANGMDCLRGRTGSDHSPESGGDGSEHRKRYCGGSGARSGEYHHPACGEAVDAAHQSFDFWSVRLGHQCTYAVAGRSGSAGICRGGIWRGLLGSINSFSRIGGSRMGHQVRVKLLVLDLDGTALQEDGSLSMELIEAVTRIQQTGVQVMLATGRMMRSAIPYWMQLSLGTGPLIAYNGSMVAEMPSERSWFSWHLNSDVARLVVSRALDSDILTQVYVGNELWLSREDERAQNYIAVNHIPGEVKIGRDILRWPAPPIKILLQDNPERLDRFREDITPEVLGLQGRLFKSQEDYFDIVTGSIREKRKGSSSDAINMIDLELPEKGNFVYFKKDIFVYQSINGWYIGLDNPKIKEKCLIELIETELNVVIPLYNILIKYINATDNRDQLTGVFNRRKFYSDIKSNLKTVLGTDLQLVIFYIDFNNFKIVNDVLGHKMGDSVLISLVGEIIKIFSGYGNIYRIGGDEFIILSIGLSDELINILKKRLESISEQAPCGLFINLAMGVNKITKNDFTIDDVNNDNIDSLITNVENIMYHHKKNKKTHSICLECPKKN
jgi:HAD superfamily hydrolase (TIGR01484 family)